MPDCYLFTRIILTQNIINIITKKKYTTICKEREMNSFSAITSPSSPINIQPPSEKNNQLQYTLIVSYQTILHIFIIILYSLVFIPFRETQTLVARSLLWRENKKKSFVRFSL